MADAVSDVIFCEPLANSISVVLIFNTVAPNSGGKRQFHFTNAPIFSCSIIFLSAICQLESSPTLSLFLDFLFGTSYSSSVSKSKLLVKVSSRERFIFQIEVPLVVGKGSALFPFLIQVGHLGHSTFRSHSCRQHSMR